jgi:hypothetical protein
MRKRARTGPPGRAHESLGDRSPRGLLYFWPSICTIRSRVYLVRRFHSARRARGTMPGRAGRGPAQGAPATGLVGFRMGRGGVRRR